MSTIKMDVTIQESLFEQADELARKLKLTRSGLVSRAIEEYVTRHQNQESRTQLNEVYAEESVDDARRAWLAAGRRDQRRLAERDE